MRPDILPKPEKIIMKSGVCERAAEPSEIQADDIPDEGYILEISTDGIRILASQDVGFFYGKKTLEQLKVQYGTQIPCMRIEDAPAYAYRSFHLDTARHFIPVDELKKNIACASAFKLNHFHWHFSDDQGYRIASDVFPLLTEIGGRRAGDHFGSTQIDREEFFFYTKEQVREVVSYASENHIEVVPEIDIPGHVSAILAAYPRLSCSGTAVQVACKEGIYREILCAGKKENYEFLEKLLDELLELFPGKYFHLGGDECPKTAWKSCTFCQAKMKEEGLQNERQLQACMQNHFSEYLKQHNRQAIAWNEAALGGNLNPDIILQLWNDDPNDPAMKAFRMKDENGKYTSPNQGIGAKHIRAGGSVICSTMLTSYCDYPHAFVKARTMYETAPVPQMCEAIPNLKSHVHGGEALCWTEYIRTEEELERMIWPRYAMKADCLWSKNPDRDFRRDIRKNHLLYEVLNRYHISPAKPREFMPAGLTAMRQMLHFLKTSGNAAKSDGYAEGIKEV